jgi:L-alanine-DL-glutamate epimerase-like enolase superfamily enzyme
VATLIDKTLKGIILGSDAMDIPALHRSLVSRIRNSGPPGLAMMAVSAVDIAAWDLKATLLELPLARLLGMAREACPLYGSGGFTSYSPDQLRAQLGGWAEDGFTAVKMKVGRDSSRDASRVQAAREAVGGGVELFVDANGAYGASRALGMAERFRDAAVTWFEEPVPSRELRTLGEIRARLPAGMRLAAGEYGSDTGYFRDMLSAGAVDVLQADATRCGGITGFLKAGTLAQAFGVRFSSHCAPLAHLHAALSLPGFLTAEYFHDHARVEGLCFDGVPPPDGGVLRADLRRPGLGIRLKKQNLHDYAL